jgi:hypothetical protein
VCYLGESICCGGLAATAFRSRLRQRFPPGGCRPLFPNLCLSLSVPCGSLIGDGLCSRGSRLSTLLLHLQRIHAAFLLVLHAASAASCCSRREVWRASRAKRHRRRSHREMTRAAACFRWAASSACRSLSATLLLRRRRRWRRAAAQSGARGGGYNHLTCGHQEGSEREDKDK